MRKAATVLSLLALLALVPWTPCLAQASSPATPLASSLTTASAPVDVATFLATLSDGAPKPMAGFQWTTCSSHEDCPEGQLCCYPCGIDGCPFVCMTPERGRCPFFP